MAKHRRPEDEPASLLPVTGQEPAAGRRTRLPALSLKRHAVLAGAAVSLLLVAVTSWALTRPDNTAGDAPPGPLEPGALASAEAIEGFGSASPLATSSPARPSLRASATATPGLPSASTSSRSVTTGGLDASYQMLTWEGGYQVSFAVTNPTTTAALWTIRVQLPSNAAYDHGWSAELASAGDILIFTPPRWDNGNPRPLAPGATHTFGFIALQPSGDYRLLSCTVDGMPCRVTPP